MSTTATSTDSDRLSARDRALLDDRLDNLDPKYEKVDLWFKEDYDAIVKSAKGIVVDLTKDDDPLASAASEGAAFDEPTEDELAMQDEEAAYAAETGTDRDTAAAGVSAEPGAAEANAAPSDAPKKKKRAPKPDPNLPSKWAWFIKIEDGSAITNGRLDLIRSATRACFDNMLLRANLIVPSPSNPTGAYVSKNIPEKTLCLIIVFLYRRYPELRYVASSFPPTCH